MLAYHEADEVGDCHIGAHLQSHHQDEQRKLLHGKGRIVFSGKKNTADHINQISADIEGKKEQLLRGQSGKIVFPPVLCIRRLLH